jgi:hypothetical protein
MLRESAVIAALAFSVLAQTEVPPQRPVQWGKRSGPFQLAIVSDKEEYKLGEAVRVTAVLKNVASYPVQHQQGFIFYSIDIRVPFPEWMPWRPQAKLTPEGERAAHPLWGNGLGITLQPGREIAHEDELSKLYDMSALGKYRIVYSCKEPPDAPGDPVVTVVSNEITVTVLPK